MISAIKTILNLCEIIAGFAILGYAVSIITALWRRFRHKVEIRWADFNLILSYANDVQNGKAKSATVLAVVVIAGLTNFVLSEALETTKIGAFYEKNEYVDQYEAIVYVENKPIFCIAELSRNVEYIDSGDGRPGKRYTYYCIHKLLLPYEKADDDMWEKYDPDSDKNSVRLAEDFLDCKIIVGNVATDRSYEMLESTVVTAYGDYCGSRAGDKYHYTWCSSAENIKDSNRVFFESENEASALYYKPCDLCLAY